MDKFQVITAKMLSEMVDKLEKIPKRKFIPIEEWINRKNNTLEDFLKMRVLKKTESENIQKPIDSEDNKMGLTQEEQKVHDKLMECFELFLQLPFQHPEDTREFTYAVHLIQGLLSMRIVRRSHPEGWVTYHIEEIGGKEECVIDD